MHKRRTGIAAARKLHELPRKPTTAMLEKPHVKAQAREGQQEMYPAGLSEKTLSILNPEPERQNPTTVGFTQRSQSRGGGC